MTRPRWATAVPLVALAGTLLAGCGYSIHGTLPSHIRTIAVPIFQNRTTEPGVEIAVSRGVVEAFATSGRLRVVGRDQADAVLEGEVLDYQVESIAYDPDARVRVYRLVVTLNLRLHDVRANRLLLDQQGLRERTDFRASDAVAETIVRESVAVREAAGDIGRAIAALTVSGF
jgi:hypothetical protein